MANRLGAFRELKVVGNTPAFHGIGLVVLWPLVIRSIPRVVAAFVFGLQIECDCSYRMFGKLQYVSVG